MFFRIHAWWLQVLYLDDATLAVRLASTRFRDDDSGRMVTINPDDDYFLVWSKAGKAAAPAAAAPRGRGAAQADEDDDEEDSGPVGGLLGGFGTKMIKRGGSGGGGEGGRGLATQAERNAGKVRGVLPAGATAPAQRS